MEFPEAMTLKRRVSGRPLEIDLLLALAIEVADALEAAHAELAAEDGNGPGTLGPRRQASAVRARSALVGPRGLPPPVLRRRPAVGARSPLAARRTRRRRRVPRGTGDCSGRTPAPRRPRRRS